VGKKEVDSYFNLVRKKKRRKRSPWQRKISRTKARNPEGMGKGGGRTGVTEEGMGKRKLGCHRKKENPASDRKITRKTGNCEARLRLGGGLKK